MPPGSSDGRARRRRGRRRRDARHPDRERRPLVGLRGHVDGAPEHAHDAVHRRQPHARALALLLGREERLEDPGPDRLVHADAGVGDGQHDGAGRPLAVVRGGDPQGAAVGHRVARVDGEVEDHLLQLAAVHPHRAGVGREVQHEPDVHADQASQHRRELPDHGGRVEVARLERGPARERQQLLGQVRRPVGRLEDLVDLRPEVRVALGVEAAPGAARRCRGSP